MWVNDTVISLTSYLIQDPSPFHFKFYVLSFQNACITTKLRDFLYVVLNHPNQECRQRYRMMVLKRKIQNLYTIITRICYQVRTSKTSALFFLFSHEVLVVRGEQFMHLSVWFAGLGVFHRRLWGHWYWTQYTSLCRGQASAAARREMRKHPQQMTDLHWSIAFIKTHAEW